MLISPFVSAQVSSEIEILEILNVPGVSKTSTEIVAEHPVASVAVSV